MAFKGVMFHFVSVAVKNNLIHEATKATDHEKGMTLLTAFSFRVCLLVT